MIKPDIIADLYFYSTEEKGRAMPTPPNRFSCIFTINGCNYDIRLLLNEIGSIFPGQNIKNVPIKFLCPELIVSKLNVGDKFFLREIKIIAEGTIIEKL